MTATRDRKAEARALRRTGVPLHDSNGDINPKASLADILPVLWETPDLLFAHPIRTLLQSVIDQAEVMYGLLESGEDISIYHEAMKRMLWRMAHGSRAAMELSDRMAEANQPKPPSAEVQSCTASVIPGTVELTFNVPRDRAGHFLGVLVEGERVRGDRDGYAKSATDAICGAGVLDHAFAEADSAEVTP